MICQVVKFPRFDCFGACPRLSNIFRIANPRHSSFRSHLKPAGNLIAKTCFCRCCHLSNSFGFEAAALHRVRHKLDWSRFSCGGKYYFKQVAPDPCEGRLCGPAEKKLARKNRSCSIDQVVDYEVLQLMRDFAINLDWSKAKISRKNKN